MSSQEKISGTKYEVAKHVSIAGIRESIEEPVKWIRRIFQLTVILMVICIIYYSQQSIREYLEKRYIDKMDDIAYLESLPMSNVTVCAEVLMNETFVLENVTVPHQLFKLVKRDFGYSETEFVHQFATFMSNSQRAGSFPRLLVRYFQNLYESNAHMHDYSAFLKKAFTSCEDVVKNCTFQGRQFECCRNSFTYIGEYGKICQQIAVSMDRSSVEKSPHTRRQSILGPKGGLIFDAKLDMRNLLWIENDRSNGFEILVHPTAAALYLSPNTAPHNTETFIKVTASQRLWSSDCLDPDHLPRMTEDSYYDQYGYYCQHDIMIETLSKFSQCYMPFLQHRPNSSTVCSPVTVDSAAYFGQGLYGTIVSDGSEVNKLMSKGLAHQISELENEMRNMLKAHCPKHCRYWEYSSTASFVSLENEHASNDDFMFSRIHVYYTDFMYRQHEETLALPAYTLFCKLANIMLLYLGMSVIVVGEIIFYGTKYFCECWKNRKSEMREGGKASKKNTVHASTSF